MQVTGLYSIRGRGAAFNPPNRFEPVEIVPDGDTLDADLAADELPLPRTQFLRDTTRTILARNDSPDIGFSVSINPYRGCEHGCIYCYARPFHEYLGFSAGIDFETRILVKEDAPLLLRNELMKKSYSPETIVISGVTDCYQPVERKLRLTRGCLEVLAEFRNPVSLITKNHLVTRDIDVLGELARHEAASVSISITTLDEKLQRVMEPRTSTPRRRLLAIEKLATAGIPVGVMVAPIIPAITDEEAGAILGAARDAGAKWAGYVMLRLPHAVAPLFEDWLTHHFPDRKEKVLNRVRSMRGGRLYDSTWGVRGRGTGEMADQIGALFRAARRRAGYEEDASRYALSTAAFRRPHRHGQLALFDE
ncbi:MAG TPA: PA0069 family radical SAM protein [Longimicrobiales bacterium]